MGHKKDESLEYNHGKSVGFIKGAKRGEANPGRLINQYGDAYDPDNWDFPDPMDYWYLDLCAYYEENGKIKKLLDEKEIEDFEHGFRWGYDDGFLAGQSHGRQEIFDARRNANIERNNMIQEISDEVVRKIRLDEI